MTTDSRMALLELLRKVQDDPGFDALREGLRIVLEEDITGHARR